MDDELINRDGVERTPTNKKKDIFLNFIYINCRSSYLPNYYTKRKRRKL